MLRPALQICEDENIRIHGCLLASEGYNHLGLSNLGDCNLWSGSVSRAC
jgi:hypothetical protein